MIFGRQTVDKKKGTVDYDDVRAGWLERRLLTKQDQQSSDEWLEAIGTFEDKASSKSVPSAFILQQIEISVTGNPLPRIRQTSGSCVGVSGAMAMRQAAICERWFDGDHEGLQLSFPFVTYGVGRSYHSRRPGDGSFGSAQARATREFGTLPVDFSLDDFSFPAPETKGEKGSEWVSWRSQTERTWSHPDAWPIPMESLASHADPYAIDKTTRITTVEGVMQALAAGFGVTEASKWGTKPTVQHGYLVSSTKRTWAHQMQIAGYKQTNTPLGTLFLINNTWGDVHGSCPFLTRIHSGIRGSFWAKKSDVEQMLKSEVIAYTGTGGFDAEPIDYAITV